MGEVNFIQEEDIRLETTRARFSNVIRRHGELAERLSRDSDKMIFERLQKEFEVARASQTQEIFLDGEQWNDGLLATIRERVHMEADRKAMPGETSMLVDAHFQGKTTYKVGSKDFMWKYRRLWFESEKLLEPSSLDLHKQLCKVSSGSHDD